MSLRKCPFCRKQKGETKKGYSFSSSHLEGSGLETHSNMPDFEIPGVDIEVVEDGLAVLGRVRPGQKVSQSPDSIIAAIGKQGITAEINRESLVACLAAPSEKWTRLAAGEPPTPPVPGRLEYYIDPQSLDGSAHVDQSGRVDYKSLRTFQSVEKGQELIRRIDPIPGKPGVDVYGKLIPPLEVEAIRLPVGEGIEVKENGYLAVAHIDGAVTQQDDRLVVKAILVVPGEVSYKSGNVDFNGTVEIGKDVLSGFEIKAEGDVLVRGIVEAATIEAKGSITVMGGFQGGGKGTLKAGGSISVGYANEGFLVADGDVIARTQLLNCEVTAGGDVVVESTKGSIAGGEIRAGKRILAYSLGSKMGVATTLQIGFDSELVEKMDAAKDIIAALAKIGRTNENRVRELKAMQEELKAALEGEIAARSAVFPGVTIRFPGSEHTVIQETGRGVFYPENWKVHMRTMKGAAD